MNAPESSCPACRDALTLVACGDAALDDLSADAAEHLAVCAACRAELADLRRTSEWLAGALAPGPLPPALTTRILNDAVAGRPGAAGARNIRRVHQPAWAPGAGFAAAAALLLACLLPWNGSARFAAAGLSEAEQIDLLAAYASLQWDGPVEYSIERVGDVLADVSDRLDALVDELEQSPLSPDDDAPSNADDEPALDSLPAQSSRGVAICAAAPLAQPLETQH